MRIVVVGTSGAGKTTLAHRIAALLELPHIELNAINWQPGWRDLTRHDPEEFIRRVNEAIEAEAWVLDGNYGPVRDRVWLFASPPYGPNSFFAWHPRLFGFPFLLALPSHRRSPCSRANERFSDPRS